MPTSDGGSDVPLAPDDAFSVLGNETRIQILQSLGEGEPLSFSELYEGVGMHDTGNFTYHLDKLEGHFVRKSDDKYALREPGSRVVQAVLSGAVTDGPVLEPTSVDAPCPYCGQSLEISFRQERLLIRCTECAGTYAGSETDARHLERHPSGTIAVLTVPPGGLEARSPEAVLNTALAWAHVEGLAMAGGICPRCAAVSRWSVRVCEAHDASGGICPNCHARFAVRVDYDCPNCPHGEVNIPAGIHLFLSAPELMAFAHNRGINPAMPSWATNATILDYEESVHTLEPLEAQFTFTIDEASITLTVDEDLNVVDATT